MLEMDFVGLKGKEIGWLREVYGLKGYGFWLFIDISVFET